ncbi:MAG: response regulator [Candidatus Aminicenantes bacterium]|uniref:Two component transcriptional regulator, winged helix family n=1 Tax=Candidatus Saccharicenans subterraneus TaxID=2508984 RepID=A0A3E2BM37_9BACT|nr:response regulator [Candidatus Aminicenantes bacterium]RFT15781.1 MAG: two component transcriptional regulator, winged helix family [Candidatus Saccharicenans subterraneum]
MGAHIAIIDDDRVTSSMLEKLLSEKGYRVVKAHDGEKGLKLVREERPKLVICDMLLPKIHGADLCRKIKDDPELKETRVVLITAVYKGATSRIDVKSYGADNYFEKPINTKELLSWVEKNVPPEPKPAPPDQGLNKKRIDIESLNLDEVVSQLKNMVDKDLDKKK